MTVSLVSDDAFNQWCDDQRARGEPLSTQGLLRLARELGLEPKRKCRHRLPDIDPMMACGILSRLLLDVKRQVAGRPHDPVTPNRILRAGDALRVVRAALATPSTK